MISPELVEKMRTWRHSGEPVFHRDFDYLDWIARLTSHIPEKGAQLVHYYGANFNAHRGKALSRQAFTLPNLRSAT